MDDGKLVKMEQDMSTAVDELLPQAEARAKLGDLPGALDVLLNLEKQTRTASDLSSSIRVLVGIVNICFESSDWTALNENIVLLMKKRGQMKQAMVRMIQEAMTYLDRVPTMEVRLGLLETLRLVTDGKIFVEIERARLTRMLAKIKEDEGKVAEAADVLQQLQVETLGSMDKKEKTDFILEQMRLLLAKQDFIRVLMVSKKINPRYFDKMDDQDIQKLKLRYYRLMVEYGNHEEQYLDVSKNYRRIYDTPSVQADEDQWSRVLRGAVIYAVLAPYDNEQSDVVHRLAKDKNLEKLPVTSALLKCFTTNELIFWDDFEKTFKDEVVRNNPGLALNAVADTIWSTLRNRVVEHNIRVVAKYYTRITLARLAQLLRLSDKDVEAFLSRLIVQKTVYGRIDRPAGVVDFRPPQDPNGLLNGWSSNIDTLLSLIERTTHMIAKEEMVHGVATAAS